MTSQARMAECKIDPCLIHLDTHVSRKKGPFHPQQIRLAFSISQYGTQFNSEAGLKQGARAIPSHFHVALAALKTTPLVSAAILTPQEVLCQGDDSAC